MFSLVSSDPANTDTPVAMAEKFIVHAVKDMVDGLPGPEWASERAEVQELLSQARAEASPELTGYQLLALMAAHLAR